MPKPLIIGVDVRDLRVAKTGTKTYLEELCKEFKKINSYEVQFHFLDTLFPIYTGNNLILKWIEHGNYQLWKQLILPVKAFLKNCDIVFCTDNFVPIIHLGYQTIPVFHDAFFFEIPGNYGRLWLWVYKKLAIPAAKKSAFVITPTAYAKKQISYFTQISDQKLVVIYEGAKTLNHTTDSQEENQTLTAFSLTSSNYILHVGSMFKRKNIPVLIQAFSKIKASGYPKLKLVLAGPINPNRFDNDYKLILNIIENTGLQNEIVITGYLSDQQISHLYQNAILYVFPSLNEGFGIPVLEAFTHNLPVLVANNTCLPEVGGDAVLQFNPFDPNDIFCKVKTVLDHPELRQEMISKGKQRLQDFLWQKTALQLIEVFKNAMHQN